MALKYVADNRPRSITTEMERPFRLLDLPPEMRDIIYQFAVTANEVGDVDIQTGKQSFPPIALTTVSKQVRQEVSSFVREARDRFLANPGIRWTSGETPPSVKFGVLEHHRMKELRITIFFDGTEFLCVVKILADDSMVSPWITLAKSHQQRSREAAKFLADFCSSPSFGLRSAHEGSLSLEKIALAMVSTESALVERARLEKRARLRSGGRGDDEAN